MYDICIYSIYTYTWMVDFVWFPCAGCQARTSNIQTELFAARRRPGRVPRSAEPTSPWHFAQPVHLNAQLAAGEPPKFPERRCWNKKNNASFFGHMIFIGQPDNQFFFWDAHVFLFFWKTYKIHCVFSLIIGVVRCMAEWEKTMVFVLRGTLDGRDQIYCKLNSLSLDAVF